VTFWDLRLSIEKSILIFLTEKALLIKFRSLKQAKERIAKGNNKENKESKVYVIKQVTEHLVPPKSVGRTRTIQVNRFGKDLGLLHPVSYTFFSP
jgi:hypothetical protein